MTGISYGQLYRWKREGLLPEEWFIKQASFTGQETFFPREQAISRVQAILEMKDDYSLEELVGLLITRIDAVIDGETMKRLPGIDAGFPDKLMQALEKREFSLGEFAVAYAMHRKGKEDGLREKAMMELIGRILPSVAKIRVHDALCTIVEANGEYHACFTTGTDIPVFDPLLTVCVTVSIGEMVNELSVTLQAEKSAKTTEGK